MKYSELLKEAYSKCGGKSAPRWGDVKEFAGHLSELLASNERALSAFLKNGKRRLKKVKK